MYRPLNMANYSPSKIFASVTSNPVKDDQNIYRTESKKAPISKKQNEIQVIATGEVSVPPDRCKVTITVSSAKDRVEDVKDSISRRLDYIVKTLQNEQIRDSDISTTKVLRRIDGMFHFKSEVVVFFSDFNKCQSISNLLVEKLDESVTVSLPEFFQSPQRLEQQRRQAGIVAVKNSKEKAAEISQFLNAKLGQVISILEDYSTEWDGTMEEDTESTLTVQQRLTRATLHIKAKVTATYELKPKAKGREKN